MKLGLLLKDLVPNVVLVHRLVEVLVDRGTTRSNSASGHTGAGYPFRSSRRASGLRSRRRDSWCRGLESPKGPEVHTVDGVRDVGLLRLDHIQLDVRAVDVALDGLELLLDLSKDMRGTYLELLQLLLLLLQIVLEGRHDLLRLLLLLRDGGQNILLGVDLARYGPRAWDGDESPYSTRVRASSTVGSGNTSSMEYTMCFSLSHE